MLKCVKCKKLIREELYYKESGLIAYSCLGSNESTTLGGLFRPGKRFSKYTDACSDPLDECCVCGKKMKGPGLIQYMPVCTDCYKAWSAWLDQKWLRDYISPTGRINTQRWIETFLTFKETQRKCRVCGCTQGKACILEPGMEPCFWIDWDLCSSCR